MAFCMAIILFFFGYVLIHQDTSGMSKAEQKKWDDLKKHPRNLPLEYLLFFGVYAYYAHQPREIRPQPAVDASRHMKLEMLRRGYLPSGMSWWKDYQNLSQDDLVALSKPKNYRKLGSEKYPAGFKTLWKLNGGDDTRWPIVPGPTASSWLQSTQGSDAGVLDFISYGYLYNRLTEWYYLVMFKDEYQRLGLNIEDVVLSEVRGVPRESKMSSDRVDQKFKELMSEIQGIVYWGDRWDEEVRGFQRRRDEYEWQRQKAMDEAEEPAKLRRQYLEGGIASFSTTPDEMTPEWAKQQLKEKYGIDYDSNSSH